jgi:beta-lactamase regulating signal transducer with metallopeptidase domain
MLWWTTQNLLITTLLAGIVWFVCRVLRVGPVWRHALWMVVLVKLLTPPLVFWPWAVRNPLGMSDGPAGVVMKTGPLAGARAAPAHLVVPDVAPDPTPPDVEPYLDPTLETPAGDESVYTATAAAAPPPSDTVTASVGTASVAVEPVVRHRVRQILPWLGGVWIAGGVAMGLLQGVRIIRMLKLLRRALPPDPELLRHVEASGRRLGVRAVAVRVVPGIGSPVVWAVRRPLLLWPKELPAGVSEQAIRGLIVHELAHVKRRDHWVGWLELLAGCVWWWDPLFWYVRHQMRENAELACDAWVVSALAGMGGREGRRAYAEALLAVCECASNKLNPMNRTAPMPAVGVSTGGRRFLERRLAMILRDRVALRLPRLGLLSIALLALGTLPAWSQKAPEEAERLDVGSAAIAPDGSQTVGTGISGVSTVWPDGRVTVQLSNVPEALPKAAREVLEQLIRDQDDARREAHRRIEHAKADTVRQLKQLQDSYTKAGQLDEAVAVRDAVRQLQAEIAAARGPWTRRRDTVAFRASADPGNLTTYRDKVGQSFYFDVTGATEGNVWGNVIYTDDSTLAAAAVHAGVLTAGQRGVVKVTILPGRGSYAGSDSNGVTSSSYQGWPGSYMVEAFDPHNSDSTRLGDAPRTSGGGGPVYLGGGGPPRVPSGPRYPAGGPGLSGGPGLPPRVPGGPAFPPPVPGGPGASPAPEDEGFRGGTTPKTPVDPNSGAGSLQQLREKVGQSIETDLVGSTVGQVWGTDIYTDDSSPAAAAVHAGVLRDGESGHVRITILPPQDSYKGSDRNGVSSQSWSSWGGSFRIERADTAPVDASSATPPK